MGWENKNGSISWVLMLVLQMTPWILVNLEIGNTSDTLTCCVTKLWNRYFSDHKYTNDIWGNLN